MTAAAEPRALIVHGFGANPGKHWFPWLVRELGEQGITASVPALPAEPEPGLWEGIVREELVAPGGDTVVVAHSLGCLTTLRVLVDLDGPWRLCVLVLVAGFVDQLPALPELDEFIGDEGCDVGGLKEHIDRIVVIRSDADHLVPTGHTDRLAELIGVDSQVVPGAGHFLESEGITELPEALAAVTG